MQRLIVDSTQASLAVPKRFESGDDNVLSTTSELEKKQAISDSLKTKEEVKWMHVLRLAVAPAPHGVPRGAVEESEGKLVLAGLWETRVVEPSREEQVSRAMSDFRRGKNNHTRQERSIHQPLRPTAGFL